MTEKNKISEKEKKIRAITQLYYSRKDVQKAIFEFSKNREISPRYFEGFGKRPDSFNYIGDVFSLVRKGATSFHCSEELWKNPMDIETGMSEEKGNKLRIGWDLLIDIDCEEGMDYSAIVAKAMIESLKQNGIKNFGLKFSGSKGFHILVPWKAFPKNINGILLDELFPALPRTLMAYLREYSRRAIQEMLPKDFYEKFKDKVNVRHRCKKCGNFAEEFLRVEFTCEKCNITEERSFKNGKGKLPVCYKCKQKMKFKPIKKYYVCEKCEINSLKSDVNFEREPIDMYSLMGLDMGLVSPRHLFRMPYSLHEKSALVSVVLEEKDLDKFIKDPNYKEKIADPLRIEVKNFTPDSTENEAAELVMQALDWAEESGFNKEIERQASGKYADFKPIKLEKLTDDDFPPCVKKLLLGIDDGKKRGLFALINFFRSLGMEKEELEKRIYEWNEKNKEPLKKGYIHTQLVWFYKRKPIMPPNCRDFYRDLGVCEPDALCNKIKNPINYAIRKNFKKNN
ncbi:hypothetical protein GW931_03605 [archaeon]|nr:hypothetical protein [archaeon]